jgi:hypothetical protein
MVGCEKFALDLTVGCENQWFSQAVERYSARMSVIKENFEKRTGNLSELLDPESLDGCPTDSETKKQVIKGRETRLTRKQSVPSMVANFVIGQIGRCRH